MSRVFEFFRRRDVVVGFLGSLLLIFGSESGIFSYSRVEVAAFITGACCVWLLVKKSIWNWPIGIINSGIFFFLFLDYKLYADMGLQLFFILMGCWGWFYWLHAGKAEVAGAEVRLKSKRLERKIGNCSVLEFSIVILSVIIATYFIQRHLVAIGGSAPLWDGLTTSLSLGATWLQARKFIQNWWLWITADLVYIPLYFAKDLALTSVLYTGFLVMCFMGVTSWRRQMKSYG